MVHEITNWRLREMLDKAGYKKVRLYKDSAGFFYIDDGEISGLTSQLDSQCIWICHFKQMTVRQWADTIIDMLNSVKED